MASTQTRSIVIPGSFALLLFLSAFMVVLLSACTDNNPTEPSGPSVDGTWNLIMVNGENASAADTWWTFNKGNASAWIGLTDCKSTFTYTTSGNRMITTVVQDDCGDEVKGSKDSLTYSIAGNQMTVKMDGDTYILKKSPNGIPPSILGTWSVTTVDGQGPPPGRSVKMRILSTQIVVTRTSDDQSCQAAFAYTRQGNALDLLVMNDECGDLEAGTTDSATWSLAGNTLTLVYASDGTTIVARRI
jgi:hypothetical protein